MRVSLNEIQVICRKAFEGIGFAPGDCDDAAEMIARPVSYTHLTLPTILLV